MAAGGLVLTPRDKPLLTYLAVQQEEDWAGVHPVRTLSLQAISGAVSRKV